MLQPIEFSPSLYWGSGQFDGSIYVDDAIGNDNNSGLSMASPLKTLNRALIITKYLTWPISIKLNTGTYQYTTKSFNITSHVSVSNYQNATGVKLLPVALTNSESVAFTNIEFISNGTSPIVNISNNSYSYFNNCTFTNSHNADAFVILYANSLCHFRNTSKFVSTKTTTSSGMIYVSLGCTCTIDGSVICNLSSQTFASAILHVCDKSYCNIFGSTWSGTCSNKRYNMSISSTLNMIGSNLNSLSNSVAGIVDGSSQVAT